MDRREFLTATAGFVSAATAGGLFEQAAQAASGVVGSDLLISDGKALAQLQVVMKATQSCIGAGRICLQHCNEEVMEGHAKEFGECLLTVQQMLPVCESVATLSAYKAKLVSDLLEGCIKACQSCERACQKHEPHFAHGMHLECKNCLEACRTCREACQKLKTLV